MAAPFTFEIEAVQGESQAAQPAGQPVPQSVTSIRGHKLAPGVLAVAAQVPADARSLDAHAVQRVSAIFDWAKSLRRDKNRK